MSVLIIAEAGVNHNGDLELAKRLIDAAAAAGADFVKFQTFRAQALTTSHAQKADYQKTTTGAEESQLEMLRKLELSPEAHYILIGHCGRRGIGFLSAAFDLDSLELLQGMDPAFYKIPSGEVTNLPYLEAIARTGKPVILSSGMCTMGELKDAVAALRENGAGPITILHCNTQYPTPFEDVNLRAMVTIGKELGVPVGYSDHTTGIEVPVAAVALGAVVIEKHFTLDKTMEGPDHKASLEPHELTAMVTAIRHVEAALGSPVKAPSPSETANREVARKSIVAKRFIPKGERLCPANITAKRPGTGISPMEWHRVVGTAAARDFEEDELIEL